MAVSHLIGVAHGDPPADPRPVAPAVHATEPTFYVIEGGMASGKCSVSIVGNNHDSDRDTYAVIEISVEHLRLMAAGAVAMAERFGDDLTT